MGSDICVERVVVEEGAYKDRYGGYARVVILIHNFVKDWLWESHSNDDNIVQLFEWRRHTEYVSILLCFLK